MSRLRSYMLIAAVVSLALLSTIPARFDAKAELFKLHENIYAVGVYNTVEMPPTIYYATRALNKVGFVKEARSPERDRLANQEQLAHSLANNDMPFVSVEPDATAVGCSSGLAYFLAYDGYTGKAAATGCLTAKGKVLAVDLVEMKYVAAAECECVDMFYVPIANVQDMLDVSDDYDLKWAAVTYVEDIYNKKSITRFNQGDDIDKYWDRLWSEENGK